MGVNFGKNEKQNFEVHTCLHPMYWDYCRFSASYSIFVKLKKQFIMKKNMGSADKIIRIILAAIFVVLYFTNVVSGTLGIILLVLAVVFVLTSLVSFCPLYLPFGIKTNSSKNA